MFSHAAFHHRGNAVLRGVFRPHSLSIRTPPLRDNSGKYFFTSEYEDNYAKLHYENIAVVHNNYIKGHGKKRSRLETYHLWDVGNNEFPSCGEIPAVNVHAVSPPRSALWDVWAAALMMLCGCGLCLYVGKTLKFNTGRRVKHGPSILKAAGRQTPSF